MTVGLIDVNAFNADSGTVVPPNTNDLVSMIMFIFQPTYTLDTLGVVSFTIAMQRRPYDTPYGEMLAMPSVGLQWGVINPAPGPFEVFGSTDGEMMGQSDDLTDQAAHTPIVTRLHGTWAGEDTTVPLIAGTVLAVVGEIVPSTSAPKIYDKNVQLDRSKQNQTLRYEVLVNDIMKAQKDKPLPPASIASQSVALVTIPTDSQLTNVCNGDPIYAQLDDNMNVQLVVKPFFGVPDNHSCLLGYVTVPNLGGQNHSHADSCWVSLVPQSC